MRLKSVLFFTVLIVMCLFTLNAQMVPTNHAKPTLKISTTAPTITMDAMPLTLTVDGAVNPELIPDDVAYRQFLQGIAFRKNLTDVEQSRREAKIKRLGLTQADHDLLIAAVAGLRDALDASYAARSVFTDEGTSATAKIQMSSALTAARNNLTTLSADGQKAIDVFIRTKFKLGIRIYSGTM